ncbi:MAG: NAD-dependent epimerase/dehydratase family protein [Chthoniobacterales bacterium]|nr:NAD-dependent epimerase/dehydratase family protein [Chthoniobacterales bacterium]
MTGGAGFIGSHLLRRLVAAGFEVHVVHRPGSDLHRIADLSGSLRLWPCDLLDLDRLRTVLESARPQAIYHLAGDASLSLRHFDSALSGVTESIERNIRASVNLFVAAATAHLPDLALLIRLGSSEEYGRGPLPYEETQRELPVSPYSASQVAVSHYLQMLAPRLDFRVLTIRAATIYGPGQSTQFLIASLIEHCLEGRDFPLGSSTHFREFAYISDLIDALVIALQKPVQTGEIINIGTGHEHVIGDVAALIIRLSGAQIKLVPGTPARAGQVEHLWLATDKAQRLWGWKSKVNLETGLQRMIQWCRERRGIE